MGCDLRPNAEAALGEREPGSVQIRVAADALSLGTDDSAGKASASGDGALPRAAASAGVRQSLRYANSAAAFSMRSAIGTPKGQRGSQAAQAVQSSAAASSAR